MCTPRPGTDTLPGDAAVAPLPVPSDRVLTPAAGDRPRGLLIGYGSIGRRHLANLYALGVTDWAVVHTGRGTLPLEAPCPVRTYGDVATALAMDQPTFAVVANPTGLHVETALACVEAGCDILLEKPVSHVADGLETLAQAATLHAASVLVGFQFRFDLGLRRVQELLGTKAAGDPVHVRATWGEYLPDWHPWEDWRASYAARRDLGGGVHHTLCHPLDYLCMLFGPGTVVAASLVDHGPLNLDVAEAADIRLRFDRDLTAQVRLDYWSQPARHGLEITCTRGTLVWDHLVGEIRVWSDERRQWSVERVPGVEARDSVFMAEAKHFLDVTAGRTVPVCALEDGIKVVRLCLATEAWCRPTESTLMEAP